MALINYIVGGSNKMQQTTINLLIDYLYNKFAIAFVCSLIGISIYEVIINTKDKPIKLRALLATSTFSTVLLCAIRDKFPNLSFSAYILLCTLVSMWGKKILLLLTNSKFMSKFLANLLKKLASDSVSKALSDTVNDEVDSKKDNKNDDDSK